MKMGMQGKILSPGMEYGDHTRISAEMFFTVPKIAYDTPCRIKKYFIDRGRLIQAEFVECFGQSEDNVKISCWKQLRFPGLYPPLPLYLLALGTMTITTGIVADTNMAA